MRVTIATSWPSRPFFTMFKKYCGSTIPIEELSMCWLSSTKRAQSEEIASRGPRDNKGLSFPVQDFDRYDSDQRAAHQ